jgi:hypothetical protein
MGIPVQWKNHIEGVKKLRREDASKNMRRARFDDDAAASVDKCASSLELPPVPADRRLVIPVRFVVCHDSWFGGPKGIDRDMMVDQATLLNTAYAGREWYSKRESDNPGDAVNPRANMQIEFDLRKDNCTTTPTNDCYRIEFIRDQECK